MRIGTQWFEAIYVLRDPDTLEIRYVGKTKDPVVRLSCHMSAAKSGRRGKDAWIRSLGKRPIMEILEWVPEREVPESERWWVAELLSDGCKLFNTIPVPFVEAPHE